jgi:hypothetical protein
MIRDFRIYINRLELAEILLGSGAFPELVDAGASTDDIHFEVSDTDGEHLASAAIHDGGCMLCLMCKVGEQ